MAGEIGSGAKQAVNEAVDETADSIGDSVRWEVKRGSVSATEMAKPQGGCFTGGTLIPTVKGEKAIREIRVDDLVLSENPETGERGYKEVRRLYLHGSSRLIHVFVGNEEIKATPEHPFWVEGKGFVTADALRAGDEVRLCDGSWTNVEKTEEEVLEEPVQVYNFEVADWHTYYVSGTGVLVHNSCGVNGGTPTPNTGQGFSSKGYNPQPGERTLDGYIKNNANPEISLTTQSPGFNNNNGNVGGEFKRFGAESHGGVSPHVHQPQRNVAPNGNVYGSVGTKTSNGGVTSPSAKDVKQLYEYQNNGKYQ